MMIVENNSLETIMFEVGSEVFSFKPGDSICARSYPIAAGTLAEILELLKIYGRIQITRGKSADGKK